VFVGRCGLGRTRATIASVVRFFAIPVVVMALTPFHSSVRTLSPGVRSQITAGGFWHRGCPVALSDLRLLTVNYRDRHGHLQTGRLVVNAGATAPLRVAFRRLFALHFPIRHMHFADFYGPRSVRPRDADVTASFDCRQAVPSPCTGGTGTGTWSMHAYGLAVDVNPRENPYVGCGQSRDPRTRPYFDRSRHRPLMVTRRAVGAFVSVGWGWGGSWSGTTKDYMHFSSTGH
jgi:hypothetical protein